MRLISDRSRSRVEDTQNLTRAELTHPTAGKVADTKTDTKRVKIDRHRRWPSTLDSSARSSLNGSDIVA